MSGNTGNRKACYRNRHAARAADARERVVGDAAQTAAVIRHQRVIARAKAGERETPACSWMIRAHCADVALLEEGARMQIVGRGLWRDQRDVDLAVFALRMQAVVPNGNDDRAHARCTPRKRRQKRHDNRVQRIVGRCDGQRQRGLRRIERRRRKQL
jgi:hypothetical protein